MEEIKRTNFQMLQEVKEHYRKYTRPYVPETRSAIIDNREIALINQVFELEKRTLLDLQNLRDFVVGIISKQESLTFWDMLSAIVFVIDGWKIKLGGSI